MVERSRLQPRWRHRWQVVRMFHNGAVLVLSSHRAELAALLIAHARNVLDQDARRWCDVRRNPVMPDASA